MRRTNAEQKAIHYTRHHERVLEQNRKWKRDNPLKVNRINRLRKDTLRNAEGTYTSFDLERIREEQGNTCPGCFRSFESVPPTIDHYVPLSKGGVNNQTNIQLLCHSCNCSKNDKLWSEWKRT